MAFLRPEEVPVIILAGGFGTRLKKILPDSPKPLAPVNGRPFLAYLLDQLEEAGFRQVVLSVGYKADLIREAFGTSYRTLALSYTQEDSPLGTGGAIRLAFDQFEFQQALILNGDSYCDVDLPGFLGSRNPERYPASLVGVNVPDTRRFGRVDVHPDGLVLGFREKDPKARTPIPGVINAGIYLLQRSLFDRFEPGVPFSIEQDLFQSLVESDLDAYVSDGMFIDIGVPASYAAAPAFFRNRHASEDPGRLILLDRDGTVIVERNYLSDPDQVELVPGSASAIRDLRAAGHRVALISNQAGIGRGYFTHQDYDRVMERLNNLLLEEGAAFDAVFFCPHHPDDGCDCRKPASGMLLQASQELRLPLDKAIFIGDNSNDIEAGQRVHAKTILVRTGYGAKIEAAAKIHPDAIVDTLFDAASLILDGKL